LGQPRWAQNTNAIIRPGSKYLSQVRVTATLTDGTGTIYKTAYLHFQLVNSGTNVPVVTGSTAIVKDYGTGAIRSISFNETDGSVFAAGEGISGLSKLSTVEGR
jgi:hypothetical protein